LTESNDGFCFIGKIKNQEGCIVLSEESTGNHKRRARQDCAKKLLSKAKFLFRNYPSLKSLKKLPRKQIKEKNKH
jgi:hypothetical protein